MKLHKLPRKRQFEGMRNYIEQQDWEEMDRTEHELRRDFKRKIRHHIEIIMSFMK